MTVWPERPASIGQLPIGWGIFAPPGLVTVEPPEELELPPELLLLELDDLPPELLLPDPELEPLPLLLLLTVLPPLLPELPEEPLLVEPLPEEDGFAPLPEPLLLPLLAPLEELGAAEFIAEAVGAPLPLNGMFHWFSFVGGELPHSQAAAPSTMASHGEIQPIFVIVTSSNRAGGQPRRGGY